VNDAARDRPAPPTAAGVGREPRCLVCGSTDARRLYRLPRFDVCRCRACDLVFLAPLPSEDEIRAMFDSLYRDGGGSVPELKDYYNACFVAAPESPLVQIYHGWLRAIARHAAGGRMLDIGCGTGVFCHVARQYGWIPKGIDEAEGALAFARSEFGLDVEMGNFETLAVEPGAYDLVTMWDVIEHSRDPRALVDAAVRCLRPGGLLALATPNQRNVMEVVARPLYLASLGRLTAPLEKFYLLEHFLYFSPATLGRLLDEARVEVLEMRRELTDLRRLTLHPVVRAGLEVLFRAARVLGLENRLFAIARKPGPPRR
jgi:SAM-dependent methyltransferase